MTHGWTPLHYAASGNCVKLVKDLLKKPSIKTKKTNSNGDTPMDIALSRGFRDVILLIEAHNEKDCNVA